jgi:hypothetical protein
VPTETRSKILTVSQPLYRRLKALGVPGEIAEAVLTSYVEQIEQQQEAAAPPETVVVIAATTAMANYWVKLNSKALGGEDGRGALVITAGNTDTNRLRGVQCERLIVVRPVDRDLEAEAKICVRRDPAQVISMAFSDRLAAAWRDANG